MKICQAWSVYFSATGTTKRVTQAMAQEIATRAGIRCRDYDFTLPVSRQTQPQFSAQDLVIFGTPVYAGRVPNLLIKYVASLRGNGALAVPVVLYGNRAYDDALMELRNTLEEGGFQTLAAAAFVGEHSFGTAMATGRPDATDLALARQFAADLWQKVKDLEPAQAHSPIPVRGNDPIGPYYRPMDSQGNFIDIRKVKPDTTEDCVDCLWCAAHCPMGSIDPEEPRNTPGICIKCNACVKGCPVGAKLFSDPGYQFHRDDLAAQFAQPPKSPELFL